jgi:hypothetical protein
VAPILALAENSYGVAPSGPGASGHAGKRDTPGSENAVCCVGMPLVAAALLDAVGTMLVAMAQVAGERVW